MWADVLLTVILVLFVASSVWLGFKFLQKKRQERLELLTQELEKIEVNNPTLTTALEKTKQGFFSRLTTLLSNKNPLSPEIISELESILFGSDIGVRTSEKLISNIKSLAQNGDIKNSEEAKIALKKQIQEILLTVGHESLDISSEQTPKVILFVGVNGVGKTTTIGKIASSLKSLNKSVVMAAGDTFRAAAAHQLSIWAERSNSLIVTGAENGDPASVIFEAAKKAKDEKIDFVLCDTAGRLHTKSNLMDELKKIHKVAGKAVAGAPHEVLLVVDATTGQNAIAQAKHFSKCTPLTGVVLTKLDGTAKGGIIIGMIDELKIPIRYVGIGETAQDLRPFDPNEFVETLFA